ncbi:hypothetical protein K440DRAFT_641998 [Wilcoxina mikolae CBS 423.85]|nr:hypothetical protein K440DRAFT_641998 [Wilcoxina mikolae CBS 423.85]
MSYPPRHVVRALVFKLLSNYWWYVRYRALNPGSFSAIRDLQLLVDNIRDDIRDEATAAEDINFAKKCLSGVLKASEEVAARLPGITPRIVNYLKSVCTWEVEPWYADSFGIASGECYMAQCCRALIDQKSFEQMVHPSFKDMVVRRFKYWQLMRWFISTETLSDEDAARRLCWVHLNYPTDDDSCGDFRDYDLMIYATVAFNRWKCFHAMRKISNRPNYVPPRVLKRAIWGTVTGEKDSADGEIMKMLLRTGGVVEGEHLKEAFIVRMEQEEAESDACREVREVLLLKSSMEVQIEAIKKLDKNGVDLMKKTWNRLTERHLGEGASA